MPVYAHSEILMLTQCPIEIIFEDDDLLVVNKPAGLVCHPTKSGSLSSLVGRVRLYLGDNRPAHLVNRLDRETSGVIILAKNPEVARQLGRSWESGLVEKEYLAIVHGRGRAASGTIDAPLGKDEKSRVAIKDCVRPDGVLALTRFELLRSFVGNSASQPGEFSFLKVVPGTGRKHQIRIHLAHIGHPIVGDKLYGGNEDLYLALVEDRLTPEHRQQLILPFHALHAHKVRFKLQDTQRQFESEPEDWFTQFLNGSDSIQASWVTCRRDRLF
jgi:23S rRNA pseudouridine1911/1915/1917 synthase